MSKYDALWRYLQASGQTQLTLRFDEIAALAGTALDHSFLTCKKELRAETPFTLAGAKELQRLGILALTIPLGSSLLCRYGAEQKEA